MGCKIQMNNQTKFPLMGLWKMSSKVGGEDNQL